MSPPPTSRHRVVRSGQQWHVLDGLLVAECRAAVLNRADDAVVSIVLKDEAE